MADFSLQLQADNLPTDTIDQLLVVGPWGPTMQRMQTAENILLEGCRGVGKTMLMRAAAQKLAKEFRGGGKILGVHATFKRYLAALPPPIDGGNDAHELGNFRAWINARILHSVQQTVKENGPSSIDLGDLTSVDWATVVAVLETAYRGSGEAKDVSQVVGLSPGVMQSLRGYTYTSSLLTLARERLGLDLLILFLDDAAHALDTRAQGAFFTAIKSLYEPRLAFKISVYPAVTRYGMDFSYGHDAVVVSLGDPPGERNISSFVDLLERRRSVADGASKALFEVLLKNGEWVELLVYCSNANPRGLLKLVAQVQSQLADRLPEDLRFEDIRVAINTVIDKHLDNMVPGVIKDLDPRLLKAGEYLLQDFRERLSLKPGPYESGRPRGYLAVTNSMQVPYLCQAALRLLVAANVVIAEGPARLSKRETGTVYLLHPGFMFRDNAIASTARRNLSAEDWLNFFRGLSVRVHAELAKSAEVWSEIVAEASNEAVGSCTNGHPVFDPRSPCEVCGASVAILSPVKILLDKDIAVLDLSDAIKQRLRQHGFDTVRALFEASDEDIDKVEYIGGKRVLQIRSAVSSAVDEFVAG